MTRITAVGSYANLLHSIQITRKICVWLVKSLAMRAAQMELARLAIPRRVYTKTHIDYVVEIILRAWEKRSQIRGMRLTYEAPFLRHFTAQLDPVDKNDAATAYGAATKRRAD